MPSNKRFKPRVSGETVHLWLDTQDIMTCLDSAKVGGIITKGMSFSQAVKWGIVVMCETMRQNKILPERTAFDYEGVINEFLNQPLGEKVKMGVRLNAEELTYKMSDFQKTLPQPFEADEDINASGLVLPRHVKLAVPCGDLEIGNISTKIIARDVNLSETEIAKWLLYSGARSAAQTYLTNEQITGAEHLIKLLWPQYKSVLEG